MKKIAILGGTRFFGKYLVNELSNYKDYKVDVYSRSNCEFKIDRTCILDLEKVFEKRYDVIIDNICFGAPDANIVNDYFNKHKDLLPSQYIFTSTSFVYKKAFCSEKGCKESTIFSFDYITDKRYPAIDYSIGKQESEYIFQHGILSDRLLIIRPPYMIGRNDHTKRLNKMIDSMQKKDSILINNNDIYNFSFVDISFLSDVIIEFIITCQHGIFNIANEGCINSHDIYKLIAETLNIKPKFEMIENNDILNPYTLEEDLCLDTNKLKKIFNGKIPNINKSLISIIKDSIEKS